MAIVFVNGCAHAPVKQPTASRVLPVAGFAPTVTHRVERGQTIYRIAKKYHVDAGDLMRANGIQDPALLRVGQVLAIPGATPLERMPSRVMSVSGAGMSLEGVRRLIGPKQASSDWRTITLHHSATQKGSAKIFHRNHMRRHMGGLFYHFVIGNGSYTGDGQIEIGYRWKKQIKANRPYDIQVCLVGDFSKSEVSEAQFQSLAHLIEVLRDQYGISIQNIRRHEDIKGKCTECPGKFFPFHRLLSEITQNDKP